MQSRPRDFVFCLARRTPLRIGIGRSFQESYTFALRSCLTVADATLAGPCSQSLQSQSVDVNLVESTIRGSGHLVNSKRQVLRLRRNVASGSIAKLTVTTPLFYANGPPHIGSAYPAIVTDVLARYAKLRGAQVNFVTGIDEHGDKIAQTARLKGLNTQSMVDDFALQYQDLWKRLSITPDHFARTTAAVHKSIVTEMWHRCLKNGDIYKKTYEAWYCIGCEAYLDDNEMSDGHVCIIHQRPCEFKCEDNYFFRLSRYWDRLVNHIKTHPDFILPVGRRNEVLAWLNDDNKRDFPISRKSTEWGIPVPNDDTQVIYVWFDALLGYLSTLLEDHDEHVLNTTLARGWPADVHVIGKDIMRFHAIYWPAMLMSAGLPLPTHILSHGFLTNNGSKMGKSLGNVIDPYALVEAFGADAVRFYLASCLSFGEDVDFKHEVFVNRVNNRLANELGNLVHRILTLCRKHLEEPTTLAQIFGSQTEVSEHPVREAAVACRDTVATNFEQVDFPKAVDAIFSIVDLANARLNDVQPWKKLKGSEEDKQTALGELLLLAEAVRICAVLLSPLTPSLSVRILTELGVAPLGGAISLRWNDSAWTWQALPGLANGRKPRPVFQRIDVGTCTS
eukprot:TRINITY_DN37853_c0_g1_i1.p1 TRINITY_DN37853_c0_g1~~TRINITY_DN37853_c0_g1_i1.p1  ORF type:complete len:620 (+),score=38.15 TRINITY_DN37853_c0_g1_i1:71-1930(+)